MPSIPIPSAKVRLWLYTIVTALLGVLVFYQVISPDSVPLWLALAAAVFAAGSTGTAGVMLHQQLETGQVEPGKHAADE